MSKFFNGFFTEKRHPLYVIWYPCAACNRTNWSGYPPRCSGFPLRYNFAPTG